MTATKSHGDRITLPKMDGERTNAAKTTGESTSACEAAAGLAMMGRLTIGERMKSF